MTEREFNYKMEITPEEQEMIDKLMKYALDRYEDGWDILYEAYAPYEILRRIHEENEYRKKNGEEPMETFEEILALFADIMGIQNEKRDLVQSFRF